MQAQELPLLQANIATGVLESQMVQAQMVLIWANGLLKLHQLELGTILRLQIIILEDFTKKQIAHHLL